MCAKARLPEIIGVRLVDLRGDTGRPGRRRDSPRQRSQPRSPKTRRANLGEGYQETHIFRGADLKPGHEIVGPAIIEETFTTIVVYPGWRAQVDDAGDYELTKLESRR